MVQYAETQHALENGIENLSAEKAVTIIEKWEDSLKDVEASGAKGIVRDLGALKTALQKPEPDEAKIKALMTKLGEATTKIADGADGGAGEKLTSLGGGLTKAGG